MMTTMVMAMISKEKEEKEKTFLSSLCFFFSLLFLLFLQLLL